MNVITQGMEVDEVDALGRMLQAKGDQLRLLTQEVEGIVTRTVWDGPDAVAFKQQWWPEHRVRLEAVADQVHGFGQSALNNASEQRTASGIAVAGPAAAVAAAGGAAVAGRPAPPTPPPVGAGYEASFSEGSSWVQDWRPDARGYDQWAFAYDGDGDAKFGNCTSFVAWRVNQLAHARGHDDFDFTNNHLVADGQRVEFGRLGNAGEWWRNAGAQFRSTEPAVGSVLVRENGDIGGGSGHVAVVREVQPNGSIVIEESSWDSKTYAQRTIPADEYPGKFLSFLP